jgi:hypothetical protein
MGGGRLEVLNNRLSRKTGLIIAGGGAVTSLFALFFMPFVMVTIDLSATGVEHPRNIEEMLHIGLTMPQLAQEYVILWLSAPVALALALLTLLPLARRDEITGEPEKLQRGWLYALIVAASLNILLLCACYMQASREIQITYLHFPSIETAINAHFQGLLTSALTVLLGGQALLRHLALMAHVSMNMGIGLYMAVFGMAATVAGGTVVLMQENAVQMPVEQPAMARHLP